MIQKMKKKKKMIIKLMESSKVEDPSHLKKDDHPEASQSTVEATQKHAPAVSGAVYGDEDEEQKNVVQLTGEKVKSADEDETLIFIKKAKIYRFRDGKWKERGDGYVKFF